MGQVGAIAGSFRDFWEQAGWIGWDKAVGQAARRSWRAGVGVAKGEWLTLTGWAADICPGRFRSTARDVACTVRL
jgi:hypothetical protein